MWAGIAPSTKHLWATFTGGLWSPACAALGVLTVGAECRLGQLQDLSALHGECQSRSPWASALTFDVIFVLLSGVTGYARGSIATSGTVTLLLD
jgi:hypothetical protein